MSAHKVNSGEENSPATPAGIQISKLFDHEYGASPTSYPGSHCGNIRVKQTPNKCQHTKLTLEKNILPPLLPGLELATFRPRFLRSYQQAFPAPLRIDHSVVQRPIYRDQVLPVLWTYHYPAEWGIGSVPFSSMPYRVVGGT